MKAVVVDPNAPGCLSLQDVANPTPASDQALVRIVAVSLNRGEVRMSQGAQPGYRPGWDLAGVVEQAAANGSGPKVGTRVVGFVPNAAWAEYVVVASNALATLPDEVTFAQAATLPVAGLTALHALEKGGGLLGRNVLITGASGGVGYFGVQLAALAGATVTALIRQPSHEALVKAASAHRAVISEDGANAAEFGPYWLIVDGVGGKVLGNAMGMVARGGTVVAYGSTQGNDITFDLSAFYRAGGARLYGLTLFYEVINEPASIGLARLGKLVAEGHLKPNIEVEADWNEIGSVAQRFLDRGFSGKAVLHISK